MTDNNNDEKKDLVLSWKSGFGEFDKIFDNFKKDFEQFLTPSFTSKPSSFPNLFESSSSMACNLVDEGDKYVVTADMPRIQKEEINLNVGDDYIEISAEHKESEEEKKKKYVRKEQSEISVHRKMSLPDKVKSDDVKAKLEHGVLTINIPKQEPTPQPKSSKIEIE